MDAVLRAAIVYLVLLVLFRIIGKRALSEITTFDFVLLLIIAEAVQQALIDSDNSMMAALVIAVTLLGLDLIMSLLSIRSKSLDRIMNDTPLVLVDDGQLLRDRMSKARVSDDDILEQARQTRAVERIDQIKYAVLERSGNISIIPYPGAGDRPFQPETRHAASAD